METLKPSEHRVEFKSTFETEYTILEYISSGGWGTVYKCVRKTDEEKIVAVKLIEIEKESKYPEQEEQILKTLKHDNILEYFWSWTEHPTMKYKYPSRTPLNELTKGVFFIETEFCDLKSLYTWFRIPVAINELQAQIILHHIAKGLKYLHDHQIIHRDIKPDNIFLCSNKFKSGAVAKIGDFGISRVIRTTMTKDVGTLYYKCPEISKDLCVKYKHKVDIYALGIIFCEMLILGKANHVDIDDRDSALFNCKKEDGFVISELCKVYLIDQIEERRLIEDMVKRPGSERPEASEVINKLLEWCPNIENETIPIPVTTVIENTDEFRIYGKDTSEKFLGIPATKHVELLTKIDLNFVSVNARDLICLEKCVNLKTIEMIIINEGDELFNKIGLSKLTKFYYRQLNGPKQFYPYITEDRLESLLFFGPLKQLWENQMTIKVIITTLSIVEIQHEDSKCSVYLTAAAGTKTLYDNLKNFGNAHSIYCLDHNGDSEFELDLKIFPGEKSLETLVVDLPNWNHFVNQDLSRFQNLKELYLSAFSKVQSVAGLDHRRYVEFSMLPSTLRILTLSDAIVNLKLTKKVEFESLSFLNCTFSEDFTLEKMEPSLINVHKLNYIISEFYHTRKNIYEPTYELLDLLLSDDKCVKFYFGSFNWSDESPLKEECLKDLDRFGIPNNCQSFLFEYNDGWKGKVVQKLEHNKIWAELMYRNKFMMPEKDEFQRPQQDILLSSSYGISWIPRFEKYKQLEPSIFQDGSTDAADYVSFKRLEGKRDLQRLHLKRVVILAHDFPFHLKGCKKLISLVLENVSMKQNFSGTADLPSLKEFFYILDEHLLPHLNIGSFFNRERMLATLFFNNKSFQDLWKKKINTLIAVDNQRVLEFNHEKGLLWLQFCDYASEIISKSGILEEATEEIKSFIIHNCSDLTDIKTIPCNHLTYLNLTKVDINCAALFDSLKFPCLHSFFFEPIKQQTKFDLCKIPPSVKIVGITATSVVISGEYKTCDCLTLKDCTLPRNFSTVSLPLLKTRKIGLIGVRFFAKNYAILGQLLCTNICETIFVKHIHWDSIIRSPDTHGLLMSLEINEKAVQFELKRNISQDGWMLQPNDENLAWQSSEEETLTGVGIFKLQNYPTS